MPRLNSYQAVEQIVQAMGDTGKLDPNSPPQVAEGIALVTLTMKDGSQFNVQVHKIASDIEKVESGSPPPRKNIDFSGKKKIRVKKSSTDETAPASSG